MQTHTDRLVVYKSKWATERNRAWAKYKSMARFFIYRECASIYLSKALSLCKMQLARFYILISMPSMPASSNAIILNIGANLSSSADRLTGEVLSRQPRMKPANSGYIPRCPAAQRFVSVPLPSFYPHASRFTGQFRGRSWRFFASTQQSCAMLLRDSLPRQAKLSYLIDWHRLTLVPY